jgi:hypothetical protein
MLARANIRNIDTDLVDMIFFVVVVRIVDVMVVSFVTVEIGIRRYEEQ